MLVIAEALFLGHETHYVKEPWGNCPLAWVGWVCAECLSAALHRAVRDSNRKLYEAYLRETRRPRCPCQDPCSAVTAKHHSFSAGKQGNMLETGLLGHYQAVITVHEKVNDSNRTANTRPLTPQS